MKHRHLLTAILVGTLALTGCNGAPTTSSEIDPDTFFTDSSTSSTSATEPIEEVAVPEITIEPGAVEWKGNVNVHDNLTFGANKGGNFRLTKSYGDFGYEEYDVQYDNEAGYKNTYLYIFPTYGQGIEMYVEKTELDIDVSKVQCVESNMFFIVLEDNMLPGFSMNMSQDEAYASVMKELGITIESADGDSQYSEEPVASDYLTMKESYIEVPLGSSVLLEHNHIPDGYSNLVFEMDDPLIAEIGFDGSIVGIKKGTTYVHIFTPDHNYATKVIVEVT